MYTIDNKFCRLFNSISSSIYEGIVKIGYEKNTSISIYYDLGLLNYLLDSNFESAHACLDSLSEFMCEINKQHDYILVHLVKQRFQFTVTSYGIEMILSEYQNRPFLKDIVELARSHHFSLDDVKEIFQRYDTSYKMEQTDNEEFQYVFSFDDKSIDEYMYCFNFNDCYYHRLLPYDYERL